MQRLYERQVPWVAETPDSLPPAAASALPAPLLPHAVAELPVPHTQFH